MNIFLFITLEERIVVLMKCTTQLYGNLSCKSLITYFKCSKLGKCHLDNNMIFLNDMWTEMHVTDGWRPIAAFQSEPGPITPAKKLPVFVKVYTLY